MGGIFGDLEVFDGTHNPKNVTIYVEETDIPLLTHLKIRQ